MPVKVYKRAEPVSAALEKSLAASKSPGAPQPIPSPPTDLDELKEDGDSFTFTTFTHEDAWYLGHLLHARLLPYAPKQPAVINISLANQAQVIFQCVTGAGTTMDNNNWVRKKRNAVLRWNSSSWFLNCRWKGDEVAWAKRYGLGAEAAGEYGIHGGGVPIRVQGVEGIVAVVVVSGLAQHEDHGVVAAVIRENFVEV